MEDKTLRGCIEIITSLFNYVEEDTINTFYWYLVCWKDGFWSVRVTDSWHKWLEKGIKLPEDRYSTPLMACQEFLKYISENDIAVSELQKED